MREARRFVSIRRATGRRACHGRVGVRLRRGQTFRRRSCIGAVGPRPSVPHRRGSPPAARSAERSARPHTPARSGTRRDHFPALRSASAQLGLAAHATRLPCEGRPRLGNARPLPTGSARARHRLRRSTASAKAWSPPATAPITGGRVRRRRNSARSWSKLPASNNTSVSGSSGTSSGVTQPTTDIPRRTAACLAPSAAWCPKLPLPVATRTRADGRCRATASRIAARYRLAGDATDTTLGKRSTSSALPPWFHRTRPCSPALAAAAPTRSLP